MAKNIPGARFRNKIGKIFVLGKDPTDGHLRPYAEGKQPQGCGTAVLIFLIVVAAASTALAALL